MRAPAKTVEQKLTEGLANSNEVGDCLEWGGYYDCVTPAIKSREVRNGKSHVINVTVPRVIWEAKNGPVPAGKLVFRTCQNNSCVAEGHIACGTRADWAKARKKAGTSKHSPATIVAMTIAARKRTNTINTMEKAREVRQLACTGMDRHAVARETGVSPDMVSDICANRAWKDTSSPFAGLGAR